MRFVVDASVAIKVVTEEEGSQLAQDVMQLNACHVPDLFWSECANIIWRKSRTNEYQPHALPIIVSALLAMDVSVHPSFYLAEDAIALAVALNHPAYDCFYIALAQRLGCPFVTADQRLVNKVTHHPAIVPAGTVLSLASVAA